MRLRDCQPERSEGAERRVSLLTTALFLLLTSTAAAQVGHPPESSPYRDIRKGHSITPTAGYFGGDGGDFGIGPHRGPVFGARYDIRTAYALQFGLGIAHGSLERFIVDPFVQVVNRRTGPVTQSVTFAELDLQFNITGGKSWNRIAPYLGAGAGLAFASGTPADTSQYEFGNKFYLVPHAGLRVFLSDRLHLRAEARTTFWKLNYPTTFLEEPREEPGAEPVISGENLDEWTTSSWLQAGIGYSFSP